MPSEALAVMSQSDSVVLGLELGRVLVLVIAQFSLELRRPSYNLTICSSGGMSCHGSEIVDSWGEASGGGAAESIQVDPTCCEPVGPPLPDCPGAPDPSGDAAESGAIAAPAPAAVSEAGMALPPPPKSRGPRPREATEPPPVLGGTPKADAISWPWSVVGGALLVGEPAAIGEKAAKGEFARALEP
mmetsp:Transcript_26871/g.58434  ORF Transcript_26871/g.58434 Transcript_26871/m.58434 type:complete len:187 (-) Transcript_26871:541-1101(-)